MECLSDLILMSVSIAALDFSESSVLPAVLFGAFALGAAVLFLFQKLVRRLHRGPLTNFCRWTGMHVPCFDVLAGLSDCVLVVDASGKIIFLNIAAETLFETELVRVRGTHYSTILLMTENKDDAPAFDPFVELLRNGDHFSSASVFRLLSGDGRILSLCDRVSAIYRKEAMEPHMILVFHDATEDLNQRTRLENALNLSGELNWKFNDLIAEYEQILDIMPVYFYIKDAGNDFRYLKCNRVCGELWGCSVEDIIGKSDQDLFSDETEIRDFLAAEKEVIKDELLHEYILPFTGKDGKRRIGHFYSRVVRLSSERRLLFGLVVDVTEESAQRAKLNSALNAFEYAFDLTGSAFFRVDTATHEMSGAKNLGTLWPLRNGFAASWTQVVYPEDMAKFSEEREKLLAGKIDKMLVDYRSDCFGDLKYYRLEAGLDLESGSRTAVIGIIQDVTETKRKEIEYHENLRRQNSILNAILSSIPSQVFIKDALDGFRYKLANRNFTQYYRISESDVVDHNDYEIFPPEVAAQLREHDTAACASPGKAFRFDEDISYRQGRTEIFKSLKICFETEDHHPYLLGVCVDVTELERAKRRAEENAEWFRLTLNSIGDGVLTTDIEGRISMMNPVAERMTGVRLKDVEHLPHEKVFRIVSSRDDSPMPSPLTKAVRDGVVVELSNHTDLLSANGKRYHIADSAAPIFNTRHEIIGAILVFRDVTGEYVRRDMLRMAVTQMELGAEMTLSATFRLDPETMKISGSKLLNDLWPVKNGIAAEPETWVYPEDLAAFQALRKEIHNGDSKVKTCVYRAPGKNQLRHYRISIAPDRGDPRRPMVFGVIQDVTEIRENAAKLKAVQELSEQIIHCLPTMVFAKDAENGFRYTLCNQAFAAFVGKKPEDVIGRTDRDLFGAEKALEYQEKDRKILEIPDGERFDEISTDAQGRRHFIRSFKRPIVGLNKRNLVLGVCVDETEMHNLLQAEQVNNELLTFAVSQSDFIPIVEKILETMQIRFKCDRVIFSSLGPDGRLHAFRDVHSAKQKPLSFIGITHHEDLWNSFLPQFRNHEFLHCADFSEMERSRMLLNFDPSYPTKSVAASPVFLGEELLGILIVSYVERRVFEPLDERMLSAMANILALAKIRERQHQAIQRAERRNQTILDNLNIPVWLYDLNGVIIQSNRAANQLMGGKTPDATPYVCRLFLTCPEGMDTCPVRRCVISGEAQQTAYRDVNGREYLADARPIFDENGRISGVVKSFFEITSLRRMIGNQKLVGECLANLLREKDILRALRLSLKSICEYADVDRCFIMEFHPERKTISCFMEYSRSGRPSELSSWREKPYSVSPEWEKRFRNSPILAIPDLRSQYAVEGLDVWKNLIEQFDCRSFYAHRINFNGGLWGYIGLIYEKHPKIWNSEELDFFGSVAYCVELTLDRRRNQREVLAALEKAKAADRAKSIFLASMSHEIRTPLNAVIGFAELLKDGNLPEAEEKDYLESIFSAGNALLALINDVLDLSKLEAGQMDFSLSPVLLPDLLREVGSIFKQKCAERGLELTLDLPSDLPSLWLDKLRIRQILFNLIGNAVKFTDRGGITVKGRFAYENEQTGLLSIHVVDTGCGISSEDQKKVFQLFVQATALRGTQAASGGTGLGLAICKRLVEQMNGTINLKSEPGKGSDFSIVLRDVRYSAPLQQKEGGKNVPCLHSSYSGMCVLLVDDVLMNLKVMSAMLRKLGMNVAVASNGADALEFLANTPADLILTDLWMPRMNGMELARKIRACGNCESSKIVAVTADTGSSDTFDMSVFDAILTKPVTLEKIQTIFDDILDRPSGTDSRMV